MDMITPVPCLESIKLISIALKTMKKVLQGLHSSAFSIHFWVLNHLLPSNIALTTCPFFNFSNPEVLNKCCPDQQQPENLLEMQFVQIPGPCPRPGES